MFSNLAIRFIIMESREAGTVTQYILYNDDVQVAVFSVRNSVITGFVPQKPELLPKQICHASADGFTSWLRERAVDMNNIQHRNLMNELVRSRDRITIALRTHMFSISDTFTCFEAGEFVPRLQLCRSEDQDAVSDFILVSSDTSLRKLQVSTPNASTDGSFTKTWKCEDGIWWLYKLQPTASTEAEVGISQVLRNIGWDAAEYCYVGRYRKRVKTRNFLQPKEFFEPYDSFRFFFDNHGFFQVKLLPQLFRFAAFCFRRRLQPVLSALRFFQTGFLRILRYAAFRRPFSF